MTRNWTEKKINSNLGKEERYTPQKKDGVREVEPSSRIGAVLGEEKRE